MSNERKGLVILSVICVLLIGIIIHLLNNNHNEKEFMVKVKESYNGFSLVEPYRNSDLYSKYPIMQINVGDLTEGDILKVKTDGTFEEVFPPVIKVEEYSYVLNNPIGENNISETPTTVNIIEEDEPTTTTQTTTSSKITTTRTRTTTTTKTQTNNLNKDETVINSIEEKIKNLELNKDNKSFKEKAKSYFIDIVDFIFYNEPIKGIYFKDLTNKAKLTVIKLALKLDNLTEKYFPNYKESLGAKYQNIKNKLVELYLDKTAEYCANHDSVCDQAKQDFAFLKKAYGITWEFIKNLGNKGITKLKEWYEIYSSK